MRYSAIFLLLFSCPLNAMKSSPSYVDEFGQKKAATGQWAFLDYTAMLVAVELFPPDKGTLKRYISLVERQKDPLSEAKKNDLYELEKNYYAQGKEESRESVIDASSVKIRRPDLASPVGDNVKGQENRAMKAVPRVYSRTRDLPRQMSRREKKDRYFRKRRLARIALRARAGTNGDTSGMEAVGI